MIKSIFSKSVYYITSCLCKRRFSKYIPEYYIGCDEKNYYQTTDANKLKGTESVTISVTRSDGAVLGQGTTQYKCSNCGKNLNTHTKECSMRTSVTDTSVDTSELDQMEQEAEQHITSIRGQIEALERENEILIKKIANASVEDAAKYRQEYNANKDQISRLENELRSWEKKLREIQQAKEEAVEGEYEQTDDSYRIPAIMQDCKTAYSLTWQGSGSWNGYTFERKATMPSINGIITFRATISIARKPKYFLGIKIHRAIVGISWELTSEYSDTQVVDVLTLDPSMSDQEKTNKVNQRIS